MSMYVIQRAFVASVTPTDFSAALYLVHPSLTGWTPEERKRKVAAAMRVASCTYLDEIKVFD